MRLTAAEQSVIAALLPFLGTAFGWSLSQRTAKTTAREQRRIEGERRRDDRRAALYQDLITRSIRSTREELRRITAGPRNARPQEEADDHEWAARVLLFASPQVRDLWGEWINALTDLWHSAAAPGERPRGALSEAHDGIREAREALVQQMRRELESWNS